MKIKPSEENMGKPKPQDFEKMAQKQDYKKLLKFLEDEDNDIKKLAIQALTTIVVENPNQKKKLPDNVITDLVKAICQKFSVKFEYHIYPDIVDQLVRIGPSVMDIVYESTKDKLDEAIKAAANYYARVLNEKSIGYLLELSKNKSEKIQRIAQDVMKEHDAAINDYYIKMLDSPDAAKKKEAIEYHINKHGAAWKSVVGEELATKILDAIEPDSVLYHSNDLIRSAAVDKIARIGSKSTGKLITLLSHTDKDLVDKVKSLISKFGPAAIDHILEALPTQTPEIKQTLMQILAKMKDPKAIPALVQLIGDPNLEISLQAITTLGNIGDKQALDPIALQYNNPNEKIRQQVAVALGAFKDSRGLGAILYLVNDANEEVQAAALKAVGNLKDPQAIPYLFPMVQNPNPNIAAAAVESLGKLGGDQALQAIRAVVKSPHFPVRRAAITALGLIGGPQIVNSLIDALKDSENLIITTAAMTLGKIQAAEAVPSLANLLKGENDSAKRIAAKALAQIGTPAVEALSECLRENNPMIKELSLEALEEIGDPRIYDWLVYLMNDPKESIRELSAKILQDFERGGKIPALSPEIQAKIQEVLVKRIE
jgi:HEAT repeat protein